MPNFTEREQVFIRTWKRCWPMPRDWSQGAISEGTSSFLDWREFLAKQDVSIEVFIDSLEQFAGREYAPRFFDVKREYNRRTNRSDTSGEDDCTTCNCTGVLYIVQDERRNNCPVIPPSRKGHEFVRARITTIPCSCSAGRRVSHLKTSEGIVLYDYDGSALYKLQQYAFGSRIAAMKHAGYSCFEGDEEDTVTANTMLTCAKERSD